MHMKHRKASSIILIAVCAGCLLFVYGRFAPGSGFPFPKCIFFHLTGYRCPGCGLQRALHRMLNLDFVSAFKYNAFLVAVLPVLALLLFSHFAKGRFPALDKALCSRWFIWTAGILTFLWCVFRNIYGW